MRSPLCQKYAPIGLSANADSECRTLTIAFLAPVRKQQETHASGLAAVVDTIRLDVKGKPGSRVPVERQPIATADIHCLKRLAMRAEKVSLKDFGDALAPAWAWAPVADHINVDGAYMIPVDCGMICSERLKTTSMDANSKPVWRTTVKTFIGKAELNEKNREAWDYLKGAGCMTSTPDFPAPGEPCQRAQTLMFQMRAEGKAWEHRRDYALKMVAKKAGEAAPDPAGLGLF